MPPKANQASVSPPSSGVDVLSKRRKPQSSSVFQDVFWNFVAVRQSIFYARIEDRQAPWTDDEILLSYRFTNVFRASDRVSQYLIRNVIYREDLPDEFEEIVFRILLFKIFNKIETWQALESEIGPLTAKEYDRWRYQKVLDAYRSSGQSIYSSAYIMPSTGVLGCQTKHHGHLKLLELVLDKHWMEDLRRIQSLGGLYQILLDLPTVGSFLAFQYAIDLNYSPLFGFSERDFVVAGPGARDGLAKCFEHFGDYSREEVIEWVTDQCPLDLDGSMTLFGRPPQLIDIQNVFCEISKYTRVSHPGVVGENKRTHIKQKFKMNPRPVELYYPPSWSINDKIPEAVRAMPATIQRNITGQFDGLRYIPGSGKGNTTSVKRLA